MLQTQNHGKNGALKSSIKGYSPHGLTAELSEAGPEERPLLETTEATAGADAVGVAEEAGEGGSRSPDSMSTTEGNDLSGRITQRIRHVCAFCSLFKRHKVKCGQNNLMV